MQGWEPDKTAVPNIESLLTPMDTSTTNGNVSWVLPDD
jgi:hypothetical protein